MWRAVRAALCLPPHGPAAWKRTFRRWRVRQDGRGSGIVRRGRNGRAPVDGRGGEEQATYPWWLLSLATVGAVAAAGTAITLFSSLGRRPPKTWATDAP